MTYETMQWRAVVERLRTDQTRLIDASYELLAHGITGHRDELIACLDRIKADAHVIAEQLDTLGDHDGASIARDGWAIIVRPTTDDSAAVAADPTKSTAPALADREVRR